MKNLTLTSIVLLFATSFLFAQNPTFLKFYQNTDFVRRSELTFYPGQGYIGEDKFTNSYTRFGLAYNQRLNNSLYYEMEISYAFELPPIEHEHRFHPNNKKGNYISFGYEMGKVFSEKGAFQLSVGGGINLYWSKINRESNDRTQYFDFYQEDYGIVLGIIPRMSYGLNTRFSIEVSSKFSLIDLRKELLHFANPAVPVNQQTNTEFDILYFPKAYNIRLGISYKIK